MKNKVRIAAKATKGRGNRWRKGESSNCNAATKKFRQRVNLMGPISRSSTSDDFETLRLSSLNLSTRSLAGGDDIRDTKSVSMDVDQESIGSCNTFASIYTNCTNVSFSRLLEKWNPSSVLHKEMIALLATITETIKEKGGTESETEYFAILITLLETTDKEETLAAIAYLLGMVVRRLPDTVKKVKFTEMSQIFAAKILANREKTNGYLMVNLIRCLSEFIKSQEANVMKLPSTLNVYRVLLDLTLDIKPKIRRSAHRAIVGILKTSKFVMENEKPEYHVLAEVTAKFCVDKFLATSINNIQDALHMLNIMRDIIPIIPFSSLKLCCEAVTRVTNISHANPLLVNGGLSVFLALFSSSCPLRSLTPQFNYILLNRLKDQRPSYTDSQLLPLWAGVMKEGYISLYSLDRSKCLADIASLLSSLIPCFESESKIVHITVSTSIQQVIQTIIAPSIMDLNNTIRATIADILEDSLQYKYQNAWGFVCSIVGSLIEHIGKEAPDLVSRFIKKLVDLREGFNTKFLPQIENAISKAIRILGPKVILDIVPLEMDLSDTNQFAHSWLIPLFVDNIQKTELRTFKIFFLPLAKRIEIKMASLDKVKHAIFIKLYSTLHKQIWSLLPSFCRQPTDIKTAFTKDFATLLRNMIRENMNLRSYCLAGLRNLIKTLVNEEDKMTLKYFAKGYLQDFITIYINPEANGGSMKDVLPVYETLRYYLSIADDKVREKSLETVLKNLRNFDGDVALRNYLLDVLLLYIPYFSTDQIKSIYEEIILPVIQKSDENSQLKKIYKIIQEICCNNNCKEFISSLKVDVINLFIGLFKSSPDRVKYLPINSLDILCEKEIIHLEKKHVPEMLKLIIDCVETGRERCEKMALNFLVNLPKYINNNTTFVQQSLISLVSLHRKELRPAEILVLGHGIFDYDQEELSNEARGRLLQLLDLLKSDQRPIIRSVFTIINLWVKKTDKEELGHVVYNIVMALNNLSENHRKAFRHEIKVLLTKLIRKFGYEMLSKLIPPYYEKVLKNIRKLEARKASSRNEATGDALDDLASGTIATSTHRSTKTMHDILHEDSDSDDSLFDENDEDDKKSRASTRKSRKARSETFIEERGDEEEIVDLLAPNINSRIHSSNPLKAVAPKPPKKDDYRMTEDGKIIFNFKEMERGMKRKRGANDDDDNDDNIDEDEEMDERASKSNVSRTSRTSRVSKTSRISKVSTSHGTGEKYKPGGKGIHRPIKKRKTGIKGARTGEEFEARKAGGDIKKKGSVDPYAYVPLNGAILNRRKKNKFKGYFNKLITNKSKSGKRKTKS